MQSASSNCTFTFIWTFESSVISRSWELNSFHSMETILSDTLASSQLPSFQETLTFYSDLPVSPTAGAHF